VVSYGGKTIPRWRTAAIFKINILPYLSEKSSDLHEILYTAADFELDERHVIKNENFQNSRWRRAAILKIVISPYPSEQVDLLSQRGCASYLSVVIALTVQNVESFIVSYIGYRFITACS